MKAAVVYARVSTSDQVRGTSLDTQADACKQYAEANGYRVAEVIREDLSGSTLHRPGLDRARDMVTRGEVDALVVFDMDRLSRSMAHLMLLTEEFDQRQADLLFVNGPREDTPEGRILFGMRGLFAEYERTKIAERTRRGKERRAHEGKMPGGGIVPFGYSFTVGDGRLKVLEDEAVWVRNIFEWLVVEHCSLRQIAERLNAACVPTKRGGVCWHRSTLQNILRNELYCGEWYWNKTASAVPGTRKEGSQTKRTKSAQVARPREEWIMLGSPAIVSKDVFEAAQRVLKRNKEVSSGRQNLKPALFRGLLVCAQCGLRLGAHTLKSGGVQYGCPGRRLARFKANCQCGYFVASKLETKAWDALLDYLGNKECILASLEHGDKLRTNERRRDDSELASLLSAEQTLKRERDKLLDLHLAEPPLISLETFKERTAIIDKKQQALRQAIAEAQERAEAHQRIEANRKAVERQCERIAEVRDGLAMLTFEDKRMFLEALELRGSLDGHKLVMRGIFGEIPVELRDQVAITERSTLLLWQS